MFTVTMFRGIILMVKLLYYFTSQCQTTNAKIMFMLLHFFLMFNVPGFDGMIFCNWIFPVVVGIELEYGFFIRCLLILVINFKYRLIYFLHG